MDNIFSIFKSGEQEHSDNEVLARSQTVNYAAVTFMNKMVEMFGTEVDSEIYSHLPPAETLDEPASQPDNVVYLDEFRVSRAQQAAQTALDLKAYEDMDHDKKIAELDRIAKSEATS